MAGLGAAFIYKPELLTLYLRTTMMVIETGTAALPYLWGDREEVILRGIGGSVWMQFAFAITIARDRVAICATRCVFLARTSRLGVYGLVGGWPIASHEGSAPHAKCFARPNLACLIGEAQCCIDGMLPKIICGGVIVFQTSHKFRNRGG